MNIVTSLKGTWNSATTMGNDVNENDPTPEQVRKAIVALATRVSDLEKVSVAGGESFKIVTVDSEEFEIRGRKEVDDRRWNLIHECH